ncbi:rCG36908 [Rattus norvegicus]|uniref:RCG36908 n=1 Tax=Rattus norvegicus TaxID=10116 RepID=A6HTS4_RAT|nr:rCG36908 [Rattus norvegicus]
MLRMAQRPDLEAVPGNANVTSPERMSFPFFLLSSTKPLPSYSREIAEIPGISASVDLCAFVSAGWRPLERSLLFAQDRTGPLVYFLWSPFPSSFLIPLATAYQQLVYKSQPPP